MNDVIKQYAGKVKLTNTTCQVSSIIQKGMGWPALMEIVREKCSEYVEHEKQCSAIRL